MSGKSKVVTALIDAGVIPEFCTRFELKIAVGEAVRASCEFFVSEEEFEKIAKAFRDNPQEAKAMARTLLIQKRDAIGASQTVEMLKIDLEDGTF